MTKRPTYITIQIDGVEKDVLRTAYIKAKTGDLRKFGYSDLTEDEVAAQLEKILTGASKDDLDIIGRFIERDIVMPKEKQ